LSFVEAEIAEQPSVAAHVLVEQRSAIAAAARAIAARDPSYAVISARGSSDNVARYAQHVLGTLCGLPVALGSPSLHSVYDAPRSGSRSPARPRTSSRSSRTRARKARCRSRSRTSRSRRSARSPTT
jgi:fructoselysine-6-P-deglycase FrlB-like protein